jgi:TonB family protein
MPKSVRFWTNVGLIGLAHVAVIYGLIRWGHDSKDPGAQSVIWMSGGAGDGIVTAKQSSMPHERVLPRTESKVGKSRDEDDDRPVLTSAPSEIQLPTPTASPARTPPKLTATPKPTLKSKATATPRPKKATLAKANPSPKPKPTHEGKKEAAKNSERTDVEKKKLLVAKEESSETTPAQEKSPAMQTGAGKGTTAGAGGGHTGGSVNESQFGWYGTMLHDRFYSEWAQPTTVANASGKNSVLVKLRIEKDGRVSSFEIVRPSGNTDLDESVKAVANRVTRVEPLPDGLGKGDHYDVKINFELNSE